MIMKKVLRRVYSTYCLLVFALIFIFLFPVFAILVQKRSWHGWALRLNRFWAQTFFTLCVIPVEQVFRHDLDPKNQFVFCANHFSFLDIPVLGLKKNRFVFVGKSSIAKIPWFGYMYRKLHITVDRTKLRSKYQTIQRAIKEIDHGKSLVMFPEGGITSPGPPKMGAFKDGPFRIAIEKQIPIVPVTIPFNWIILPNDGKLLVRWRKLKVIYHSPITTKGMNVNDIRELKQKTFDIITGELEYQNLNGSQ